MNKRSGFLFAVGAYLSWGLLPLFWKTLQSVDSFHILAHRIVWASLFFWLLLRLRLGRNTSGALLLAARNYPWTLLISSALVSSNWCAYIYAVNSGHVLEASLGYFISPLVSIFLGLVFLKERLSLLQWSAVILASAGLLHQPQGAGANLGIAVFLGITFALYALVRKRLAVDPLVASTCESIFLTLPCIVFFLLRGMTGLPPETPPLVWWIPILLVIAGVVTALPLLWFVEAGKRLPLSTVGFFQYLSPTLQFCLAVFVFKESFTSSHLQSFACIWAALALYTVDLTRGFLRRPGRQPVAVDFSRNMRV